VHQFGFLHTDKTKSVYAFIVARFNWLHQILEVLFVTHNANIAVWYMLVQDALTFSVFVFLFSFSYCRDRLLYLLLFTGLSLPALSIFNWIYLSTSTWVFLYHCVMRDCNNSTYRGVASTTHSHLATRLKKEHSYTSTPSLGFLGLL
jgi:hypothetical protein